MSNTIKLLPMEREELTQRTSRQSGRADEARRARLILLLGCTAQLGLDPRKARLHLIASSIDGISGLGQNASPGYLAATPGSCRPRSRRR